MNDSRLTIHAKLRQLLGPHPGTIIFTSIFFIFFFALIWYLCGEVAGAREDQGTAALNRLLALLGGIVGWMIGMAFAPYSYRDQARFEAVGKVVVAFASGYFVSKFNLFVDKAFFPYHENINSWIRLCLFSVAMLLGATTVFTNRLYAFKEPSEDATEEKGLE